MYVVDQQMHIIKYILSHIINCLHVSVNNADKIQQTAILCK
jgi:hypothetical protein